MSETCFLCRGEESLQRTGEELSPCGYCMVEYFEWIEKRDVDGLLPVHYMAWAAGMAWTARLRRETIIEWIRKPENGQPDEEENDFSGCPTCGQ